jgi:hypothetical protein
MPTIVTGLENVRYEAIPSDNLMISWNYDPADSAVVIAPAAGVLTVARVRIPVSCTISNVISFLRTAAINGAASIANSYCGVYSSSGILLGGSADQSSAFQTLGSGCIPSSLTATSTGSLTLVGGPSVFVYVGRLIGTQSTTAAGFATRALGQNVSANIGLLSSGTVFTSGAIPRTIAYGTGLTALPTTIVTTSSATPGVEYFNGLS